jgi:hypothetical protein
MQLGKVYGYLMLLVGFTIAIAIFVSHDPKLALGWLDGAVGALLASGSWCNRWCRSWLAGQVRWSSAWVVGYVRRHACWNRQVLRGRIKKRLWYMSMLLAWISRLIYGEFWIDFGPFWDAGTSVEFNDFCDADNCGCHGHVHDDEMSQSTVDAIEPDLLLDDEDFFEFSSPFSAAKAMFSMSSKATQEQVQNALQATTSFMGRPTVTLIFDSAASYTSICDITDFETYEEYTTTRKLDGIASGLEMKGRGIVKCVIKMDKWP